MAEVGPGDPSPRSGTGRVGLSGRGKVDKTEEGKAKRGLGKRIGQFCL